MVKVDYSRDALITRFGRETLRERYLMPGETSPQDAFARVCTTFGTDAAHAQRLYDYVSSLWFGFASPVLSNGGTKRGQPISCFLNVAEDSRSGLLGHYAETAMLSSVGGGVGAYWGLVRSDGQKTRHGSASSGVIPFVGVVDRLILAFSQGGTRRGSYAAYLDDDHPEIEEFIGLRKPHGGDHNRKTLNLHNAVCLSDRFMQIIERCIGDPTANDDWQLVDPHTRKITKTISARALFQKILETRLATGEPYILFKDTVARAQPAAHKKLGLTVHQSNLCTEITLPTGLDHLNNMRTAVCCLSSINLVYYDEWKDHPTFVRDVMEMLDNVLQNFIDTAPPELKWAVYSATRERSIGMGVLGWHELLQSKHIPFGCPEASALNAEVFAHLQALAMIANDELGEERGVCPDALEAGLSNQRFMHTMALAPTATNSIICGETSPGIEPFPANAFLHKTLSGSFLVKNKHLQGLLKAYGHDTPAVWNSIVTARGSAQHLDFLSDKDKQVFLTAQEISMMDVVEQAAVRAPYIDQAQSINLYFPAGVEISELFAAHFAAWKRGVKSLYYVRSASARSGESVTEKKAEQKKAQIDLAALKAMEPAQCESCEG